MIFVAADGDAGIDARVEAERLRVVGERQNHPAEGSVRVDVAAGDREVFQDFSVYLVEVVDWRPSWSSRCWPEPRLARRG